MTVDIRNMKMSGHHLQDIRFCSENFIEMLSEEMLTSECPCCEGCGFLVTGLWVLTEDGPQRATKLCPNCWGFGFNYHISLF